MHPKILSLAFLLSLGFVSKNVAQNVSIGFSGGPAYTDLSFDNDFTNSIFDPSLNFLAGANITLRFSRHFGIRSGFNFERKGTKADYVFTGENGEPISEGIHYERFDYFTVPFVFEATFGGKTRGIIQAGQSVGFLIQHTTRFTNLAPMQGDDKFHRTESYNRVEYSIIGGLGFETKISETTAFQFLVRPSYGVSNINKDSFRFQGLDIRTFTIGGTLGLQLFLN